MEQARRNPLYEPTDIGELHSAVPDATPVSTRSHALKTCTPLRAWPTPDFRPLAYCGFKALSAAGAHIAKIVPGVLSVSRRRIVPWLTAMPWIPSATPTLYPVLASLEDLRAGLVGRNRVAAFIFK